MFYRGKSGNYVKVTEFEAAGEDQVLVHVSDEFSFFTSEDYFKSHVVKNLPVNLERQAALEVFIESLPE